MTFFNVCVKEKENIFRGRSNETREEKEEKKRRLLIAINYTNQKGKKRPLPLKGTFVVNEPCLIKSFRVVY